LPDIPRFHFLQVTGFILVLLHLVVFSYESCQYPGDELELFTECIVWKELMIRKIQTASNQPVLVKIKCREKTILIMSVFLLSLNVKSQNTSYTQLGNELQFARAFNDKWAAEVFLGGTFSDTPNESKVLKTNIQRYFFVWGNYYYSPRWKFSSSFAYYNNKDVPDIGQYFSPEYRLTLQGIYYFHKTGYTIFTRMRGEFRYMMNADGVFEDKYRYRQMIKFIKPINSQVLRKGVGYFVTDEELLFKPNAKTKGIDFLDRNRFEIGGGYLITDDLQLELTYVNEYMPRDNGNEVYNCLSFTVTMNNPFQGIRKSLTSKSSKTVQ
jgi:hypothetical protein